MYGTNLIPCIILKYATDYINVYWNSIGSIPPLQFKVNKNKFNT